MTEGRTALLSAVLATLSIYVSGFSPVVSVTVMAITLRLKNLRSLRYFTPFIALFFFSAFLLGGLKHALIMTLAVLAMLLSGLLVTSVPSTEFGKSLAYFGFPEAWAFQIALAIRMFSVLKNDARRCVEATGSYFKALKAFASIAVLRSVALAETLYCRNYSGKIPGELKKPELTDYITLLLLLLVFAFSIIRSTLPLAL